MGVNRISKKEDMGVMFLGLLGVKLKCGSGLVLGFEKVRMLRAGFYGSREGGCCLELNF